MSDAVAFRTIRLSGRAPGPQALGLYNGLFDGRGESDLDRDMQDWQRHRIAPWTLSHAGHDVGVGGFRIGFGDDGLEVIFHFLPEVWGQGLASEFLIAALDHATYSLRANRFFGRVPEASEQSRRIMQKVGFRAVQDAPGGDVLMRLG
ncbi:GNAT family N-acetyltransferase [Gymnodinialimonas ulvae]|uniref:GNAT family N-acetyltransferase n=1 Tax=Gymnodinialimonas ulvae TaxID=3126504 RepID=UPI003096A448